MIHSDPRTSVFDPAGPMAGRHEARAQLDEWVRGWAELGQAYWAVEERGGSGVVIGFGGYRLTAWSGRRIWNLAYRLTPEVWGRGYATEVAGTAVERWRSSGSSVPLVARTTAQNAASQRTALRAGLERRADLDVEHDSHTEVVFALGWGSAAGSAA